MDLKHFIYGRCPPQGKDYRWYHIILTTYGAWLYGDRRGFRTRHHREHVEGDYKNQPPVGKYAAREQQSKRALRHPPVRIPKTLRSVIGLALIERYFELEGFVLRVAVLGQHVHLLVKLPRSQARKLSGLAKRHAWFALRDHGWKRKLWGKRGKAKIIRNREHQLRVYDYIGRHEEQSAWVWTWRKPEGEVGE